MRSLFLVGIALCASVAGAAVLGRAMIRPLSHTENVSSSEPESFGSTPVAEDQPSPARAAPVQDVPAAADDISDRTSEENRQVLSGLTEALRASQAVKVEQGRRPESDLPHGLPQGQGGSEIDDLARQLAPALAKEALSPQKPPGTIEVESDLLETLKEQKDILAGKRDTIDSILREAH